MNLKINIAIPILVILLSGLAQAQVANITSTSKTVSCAAGPQGSTNPSQTPSFNSSSTNIGNVANTFYDANKVDALLNSEQGFGSTPLPGYTLFVADLHPHLPSLTTS